VSFRLGVLASGSGTNLQALLDTVHGREAEIVAVASDKPDARALTRAADAGVPTRVFPRDDFASRQERDDAIAAWLHESGVELVVLAGYMRLISPSFLAAFPRRVINVHPSLLPAFPGIGVIAEALDYGAKVTGVTVHFVDEGVDTGAIIFQRAVEIGDALDPDALHDKLRPTEHELLCEAVRRIAAGRVRFDPANDRRVIVD
jgi:phosphoribosylglycinamide formyltransferase-1